MDEYDVVVVGAGPPGENAALRCTRSGLEVAIVEERLVGGECSYYGCIPSKTLLRPGDVVAAGCRVPGAAEAITGRIDVAAALAQRDYMTSSWDDSAQLDWLASEKIHFARGRGRLAGPREVQVHGLGGTSRTLTARRAVVLACGTVPVIPPIEGLRAAHPWDNRDATRAKHIPRRFLVLGGGAIGVELAQAFKRLGSEQVTIVEAGPRLMGREEPFAGVELEDAFESEGIEVVTDRRMIAVHRQGADGPVTATLDDGRKIVADEILVAVGRRPTTTDIGLDTVGLGELAGRYLPVDRKLRVDVDGEWLYAVGDCNGLAPLTHMGKYQGRVAGDVILGKQIEDVADYGLVPRVTFTDPQIGAVGLTEAEARDAGIHVRVVEHGTGEVAGAYTLGNGLMGTSRLVIDGDRRVVVGATFAGPGIQEMVHAATIAIVGKVPLETLWHAVPSFPTVSEVWLRMLEAYGL